MKGFGGKLWRAAAWGVAVLWAGAFCVALHYGWRALVADTFIILCWLGMSGEADLMKRNGNPSQQVRRTWWL